MIKKVVPLLLLTLVALAGCSTRTSDHDGARLPAARPQGLTVASGVTIDPGQISQIVEVGLHTDGSVTLQAEFAGTRHFKRWMDEQEEFLQMLMGGELERVEEGDHARFIRRIQFDSAAELNESGIMTVELFRSPLYYTLDLQTEVSSYSADDLVSVFTLPEEHLIAEEDWGAYLLDAFHLRYQVTDERTGAQYTWERSAREIGSGQTVTFADKAWRPLAWVLLGLAGMLLAFVTWAGLFGERVWSARAHES